MTDADVKKAFAYEHLKPELQEISKPFYGMAVEIVRQQPLDTWLRRVALEKLLEAKDASVRLAAQEYGG